MVIIFSFFIIIFLLRLMCFYVLGVNVNRKGQAAIEFLTTYGWALLAVIAAIGAFTYFMGGNTEQYVPDRCSLGSEFICNSYAINQNGSVIIEFKAASEPLNVSFIRCTFPDGSSANRTYNDNVSTTDYDIIGCPQAVSDESFEKKDKVTVEIVYSSLEPQSFNHVAKGEIVSTITDTSDSEFQSEITLS